MNVKVIHEFLDVPVGTIGLVTNQQGEELKEITHPMFKSIKTQIGNAMWVKFPCKDLPVGVCQPFEMHVVEV
jgi:hypothetical protein